MKVMLHYDAGPGLAAQLAALEIEDPYIADLHTRVLSRVSQADTPHKR